MASMQCYKTAYETCQRKCNDNFVAHTATKGNHHGHDAGYHMASSQTKEQYPHHALAKAQTHCHSQTNSLHTKNTSNGPYPWPWSRAHVSHGHDHDLHVSHGVVCHSKTEKKMIEKKFECKKEKSVYKKKSKDCNRSCSDSDSSSGCDSD